MKFASLKTLGIKIYADGADLEGMKKLAADPLIAGLTTNPTLMKKAGIQDYEKFSREVLQAIPEKPISLEVFADDFPGMKRQALKIRGWGKNVYVKIPITNTSGESSLPLIGELAAEGVALNVTALLPASQVEALARVLPAQVPAIVSVFAGRIADTGVDPVPLMMECRKLLGGLPRAELLWASVREVLNLRQAAESGCHIVTVPHDILAKAKSLWAKELEALSLDTVKMFHQDAVIAGFQI
jgi:transaldolase